MSFALIFEACSLFLLTTYFKGAVFTLTLEKEVTVKYGSVEAKGQELCSGFTVNRIFFFFSENMPDELNSETHRPENILFFSRRQEGAENRVRVQCLESGKPLGQLDPTDGLLHSRLRGLQWK